MTLYWMSFADPKRETGKQFLGVVLIDADNATHAMRRTWELNINPGGEIRFTEFESEEHDSYILVPEQFRERLLNMEQVRELVAHVRTITTLDINCDTK